MDKLQRFMGYDQKENYERVMLIIAQRILYESGWSVVELEPSILNVIFNILNTKSRLEICDMLKNKDIKMLKMYLIEDFKKIYTNLKMNLRSGENMGKCDNILKQHYQNNLSMWKCYTRSLQHFISLVYSIIYAYFFPFLYDFDYNAFDYFCLTLYFFFLLKISIGEINDRFLNQHDKILKIKQKILSEVSNITVNYNLINETNNYDNHSKLLIDYITKFIDEMYTEEINISTTLSKSFLNYNEQAKWASFLLSIVSQFNPILIKHITVNVNENFDILVEALLLLEDKLIENNVYEEILNRICEDKEYDDLYIEESEYLFKVQHLSHRFLENIIFVDACVTIPRNQWICFHGNSGCGKTTLCKMLLKKLTPNEGKIMYLNNNRNSCDYEYENLRSHISFVDPSSDIFNETILYNLTYGINELTEEVYKTMYYYMYYFQLDKYVDRLQENIGKLSTGEKQRIKIIRLILHDKPIWMIDEITSNVDNDTEKIILQKLKEIQLEKKKSVIHITHNLENMAFADLKMYIKDYKILTES